MISFKALMHCCTAPGRYKGEPGCITLTGFLDVMTAPTLGLCYAAPELELLRTVINQVQTCTSPAPYSRAWVATPTLCRRLATLPCSRRPRPLRAHARMHDWGLVS